MGIHDLEEFHKQDEELVKQTIIVNCYPIVLLSRFVIPHMILRTNHSAIVNLSSIAGRRPMPCFAVYSASRVFGDFLSRALAEEYKGRNIDIVSLRPGIVDTSHSFQRKSEGIFQISPEQCSREALRRLGNEQTTSGHWIHKIYVNIASKLPDFYIRKNARQRVEYKRNLEKNVSH